MYSSDAYGTATGLHFPSSPLTVETLDLGPLHARMMAGEFVFEKPDSSLSSVEPAADPLVVTDNYTQLKEGRWQECESPRYPSQSEADLAFASYLAQEFSTVEEIDQAFRASGLFRNKWDRPWGESTYGLHTIQKALASTQRNRIVGSRFKNLREIMAAATVKPDWIFPHFVERTAISQLSAKIKAGKTSFMLSACASLLKGMPFLGQPIKRGNIVLVTEQNGSSFCQALKRAGLVGLEGMSIMQRHDAFGLGWPGIVAAAVAECERTNAVLLVFDTFSQLAGLAGDDENSSGAMLAAMRPLQAACGRGWGIWYSVHERKSGGDVEDAARGSSATGGVADVLMSL